MPIIGTPVVPTITPADQTQAGIVVAEPGRYYNKPLPFKRRGLFVSGGVNAVLRCQLLTRNCVPVDLAAFGFGLPAPAGGVAPGVVLRMREAVAGANAAIQEATANVIDQSAGEVEVALPPIVTVNPGVYDAEFGVYNAAGTVGMTNRVSLWVDSGLFGQQSGGLPALDEVRLAMQDTDPGANLILNDFENDLADLCFAAVNAVRVWNEAQPSVGPNHTTNDYPYTQKWLSAIVGIIYTTRAKAFLRNHLPYQAGGVAVDDQNKWQQYAQLGQQMLDEYKEWVKQKKTQFNCEEAITSLGSPYYVYDRWS
jgi:hypothetical protein